jgi:uncharacterized repeat protein (TIGR03803 family)
MSELSWVAKVCGALLLWAAMAAALPAQTFTSLHSFDNTDGATPWAGLVQGTDGNFYGTTLAGGAYDGGTIFKITPSGILTTLYSFDGTTGYNPTAGLIQATDGDFYGTAYFGGCGTIFKMTPSGAVTLLYAFDGTDGERPAAALVQGTDGNFYGTTSAGGLRDHGTVFKITPSGVLTTLHSFINPDGAAPRAPLIQGSDGNFYGTTIMGGAYGYFGTVFKITPSGTLTTLHSFDLTDGACPWGGLVQGTDGDFYGTTLSSTNYVGTIYEITSSDTFSTIYTFCSETDCADGEGPWAGLLQGTDGNLYGTTTGGGASGVGTVFEITLGGTLTTLHSFDGTDGEVPYGALIQGTNGIFYGTTVEGGTSDACDRGCGTVFSLNAGLGQFVETNPTSGKVGAAVKILGSFLTGATSVTFNGTAAAFTVNSKSEIATTVPTGATTGTVQVISPRLGTLSSNVPFTVRP